MTALSLVAISVVIFASTNVDDLLILTGFFADSRFGPGPVFVGLVLGIGSLVTVSLAAALLAIAIPPGHIGLLGFAPMVIGLKKLLDTPSDDAGDPATPILGIGRNVLSVSVVTMANGGDNVGAYT